ncbi:MAG TPA: HAD family phosphatase [Streptosporangiaceae bacterium]|jgi:beta-phosphoglucomutase-like phosphatase (HAD superfamily)
MKTPPTLTVSAETGAILFDLDGTLADTDPLHAQAWQEVVKSHFGITFTWPDYYQACIIEGQSPTDFLLNLGADVRAQGLNREKAAIFRGLLRSHTLAQGVAEFLTLATEAGITLAIVSSGSRSSVNAFLSTIWPGTPPAVTISRDETFHHKPDPEPYLLALTKLDRKPAACIAIEDTARGIESARCAGLRSILISADAGSSQYGADLMISSLRELTLLRLPQGEWTIQKTRI